MKNGVTHWAREVAELQGTLREAKEAERAARSKRKDIEASLNLAMIALEQEVREARRGGSRS